VTAPPAAAQTAAPEAPAPAPTVAAPAATPAPVLKTVGTPVVHDATADAAPAPSAPKAQAAPTHATSAKRISTAPAAHVAAPVATASVAPAKVKTAPAPVPAPVAKTVPTAAETAAATPAAVPAPVAATTQTTHATAIDNDALPIAGGVGLAVIVLGGATAYAMSRRRREREEDELLLEPASTRAVAVPEGEPEMVAPTVAAPVVAAPVTATAMPKALPNGFDISRFGRHTQAAYLGPTPDNPSHSLKRRLKRASFFDQREREALAAGKSVDQAPIAAPVTQAAAKQDDGQITVRLSPQRKSGGFGYILQR